MVKVDWRTDNGPVKRNYRCPNDDCGETFTFVHKTPTAPGPKCCPYCGYDPNAEPSLPQMEMSFPAPHLEKTIKKVADQTYRQMEAGSEFRAQKAMEDMGLSREEANGLKITDMKDNNREGEDSAKEVVNPVTDAMRATPNQTGFQPSSAAAEFARTAHSGPHAHAGLHAMMAAQSGHAARQAAVEAGGKKA